jgi:hypothetical protein
MAGKTPASKRLLDKRLSQRASGTRVEVRDCCTSATLRAESQVAADPQRRWRAILGEGV